MAQDRLLCDQCKTVIEATQLPDVPKSDLCVFVQRRLEATDIGEYGVNEGRNPVISKKHIITNRNVRYRTV